MAVPFLGSIPIDSAISANSDKGISFLTVDDTSSASNAFNEIVSKIENFIEAKESSEEE